MSPPYIVAIVELDEQTGLRLTSNLLDCGVDDVAIGMRVTVDSLPVMAFGIRYSSRGPQKPDDRHVIRARCCHQRSRQSIIGRRNIARRMKPANAV